MLPQVEIQHRGRLHGSCHIWYTHVYTYIWLIFMVNLSKYTIHGLFGYQVSVSGPILNGAKLCPVGWNDHRQSPFIFGYL